MTFFVSVLNEQIDELGAVLQKKLGVDEFSHVALPVQEEVTVVGRVCCDSNGKLNAKSVVLEGSRDTSAGRHIPVDLSGVPNYSLFPGQVVAMNGSNTTGNKFIATKIHEVRYEQRRQYISKSRTWKYICISYP